jgi:hypothetical protein
MKCPYCGSMNTESNNADEWTTWRCNDCDEQWSPSYDEGWAEERAHEYNETADDRYDCGGWRY